MAPVKLADKAWKDYVSSFGRSSPAKITGPFQGSTFFELVYNSTLRLRYTVKIYGKQPEKGFPLFIGLHGGGGGNQNDDQWRGMAQYHYGPKIEAYVKDAVYIAARGITDTWDLHFRPETYFLFQRLVRNLLFPDPVEAEGVKYNASTFVNPDRVYVLGFSAGGDGVYRLTTTISDAFAAANMSAGHPGAARLYNLANVPLCLQVGEGDGNSMTGDEYERNQRTVEVAEKLDYLHRDYPNYYNYSMFMHPTAGKGWAHNSWQIDELTNKLSPVFKNWGYYKHDQSTEDKNTCAVLWANQYTRSPLTYFVVWDTRDPEETPIYPAEWGKFRFRYWLAVTNTAQQGLIKASYYRNTDANDIWILSTPCPLIVLLNSDMIAMNKPTRITYGSDKTLIKTLTPVEDSSIQDFTVTARGDPRLVFSATIKFDPSTWTAVDGGSQVFAIPARL